MYIILYCSCTFCLQVEENERSSSRGTSWFNPQRRLIQTLFIQRPTAVQQVLCHLMHRHYCLFFSLQTQHLKPQREHGHLHEWKSMCAQIVPDNTGKTSHLWLIINLVSCLLKLSYLSNNVGYLKTVSIKWSCYW